MSKKLEIRAAENKLKVEYASGKTNTVRAHRKLICHVARGLYSGLTWCNLIYQGHEHLKPGKAVNVLENEKVYIIF